MIGRVAVEPAPCLEASALSASDPDDLMIHRSSCPSPRPPYVLTDEASSTWYECGHATGTQLQTGNGDSQVNSIGLRFETFGSEGTAGLPERDSIDSGGPVRTQSAPCWNLTGAGENPREAISSVNPQMTGLCDQQDCARNA